MMRRATPLAIAILLGGALPALAASKGDAWVRLCLLPTTLLVAATPLALLVASMSPRVVGRAVSLRERAPIGTFVVGGIDLLLVAGLGALFQNSVVGQVIVLLLIGALLVALVVGLVGTARTVGARLLALGTKPVSDLGALGWGWAIVALTPLLPVAGTIAAIYLGLGAIGSGLLAFVIRGESPAPEPAA